MKEVFYNIVVCGGGVAAVAAVGRGAKTAIIEKQCLPGGLAIL
jgi:pyruvate/2-oxoglutarate dehydrogenase complex dihydrolipoamide dehydrogenase (E3) component